MIEHWVGAFVVSDASEDVAYGLVTNLDLLYVISEGLDPETCAPSEIPANIVIARCCETGAEAA